MYYTRPGRPKEIRRPRIIGVRIEEEHYEALKKLAYRKEVSVSAIVREAIEYYLKQKGELKEDKKENSEEEDERRRKINENLKIMRKAKLEVILDDIQKRVQKSLKLLIKDRYGIRPKTLDEVLNEVEKDRRLLKEYWVAYPENPNRGKSLPDKLVDLRKEFLKDLSTIEKVISEAEQNGLDDTLEKASSLGGTLGNYILRINTILEQ